MKHWYQTESNCYKLKHTKHRAPVSIEFSATMLRYLEGTKQYASNCPVWQYMMGVKCDIERIDSKERLSELF